MNIGGLMFLKNFQTTKEKTQEKKRVQKATTN